jgi:hypothetical protein
LEINEETNTAIFEDLDLNSIHEENARELIERLLNMVEQLSGGLQDARAETQHYRDEVNRLKGEPPQWLPTMQKKMSRWWVFLIYNPPTSVAPFRH